MKHLNLYLTATLCIALLFVGCKKPTEEEENAAMPEHGAIVLNEGGWGNNEAELSVIDYSDMSITNSFFSKINGRGLGDVAQDVIVYGGKVYVAVWGSNTIEVLDRKSGKATQIKMGNRGPRYIACDGGKVYVSCYSPTSVVRIDTASLQIEATCQLSGLQPEGLCVVGDNIYVVNTWKNDNAGNPMYDSTMSVVSKSSFTETQKITVGVNPAKIKQLDNSHVAISYTGNYDDVQGGVAIVDLSDLSVRRINSAISNMDTYGGKIYYYAHNYGQAWNGQIHMVDGATLQESTITVSETTSFSAQYYPYAINVNPTTGEIYIAGAQYGANGDIYCFTQSGSFKWKLEAGPLPSKIVEL